MGTLSTIVQHAYAHQQQCYTSMPSQHQANVQVHVHVPTCIHVHACTMYMYMQMYNNNYHSQTNRSSIFNRHGKGGKTIQLGYVRISLCMIEDSPEQCYTHTQTHIHVMLCKRATLGACTPSSTDCTQPQVHIHSPPLASLMSDTLKTLKSYK